MRLIGAGVGRTGTNSLQAALELLLGGPCYHMVEVFKHPDHVPVWHAALTGGPLEIDRALRGYTAEVDFPSSLFWRELMETHPEAPVLLSERRDADEWWRSADRTIFEAMRRPAPPGMTEWRTMTEAMLERFGMTDLDDAGAAKAAYERHNAEVRAGVPAHRLVCWRPGDGWEPICAALGVPVPDEPFPHLNTTDDFRAFARLDTEG